MDGHALCCWLAAKGATMADKYRPGQEPRETPQRKQLRVRGVVQGVGFRPFVYRLALEEELAGFVGNDTDGVTIEIEGPEQRVEAFLVRLRSEAPPLARIDSVAVHALEPNRRDRFPDCDQRGAGPRQHRDSGRCGHLPGLPARVARSPGPPLPLSVSELHQLRAALHHHAPHSLRPAADLDGEVPHVPRLPAGVRRPLEPALPCAAECVLGLRAAGLAGGGRWRGDCRGRRRGCVHSNGCWRARSWPSRESAAFT